MAPKQKRKAQEELKRAAEERAALTMNLERLRNITAVVAAMSLFPAIGGTVLSVQGEMHPAWHRFVMDLSVLAGFAFIAAVCTLLCVTIMRNCTRAVFLRLNEMEGRTATDRDETITKAVGAGIDAMKIAEMSVDIDTRRHGGR